MWYSQADMLVAGTGIPYGGSDPNCNAGQTINAIEPILGMLANKGNSAQLMKSAGDLFKYLGDSGLYQNLANNTGGVVHDVLLRNGPRAQVASCAVMAVLIPSNAKYRGYRLKNTDIDAALGDPGRIGGCTPGVDCSNGYSRFLAIPELKEKDGVKAVGTVFANWSHNRRRVGHLGVFFTLPSGSEPPPQL
jgi:hypothetical protein